MLNDYDLVVIGATPEGIHAAVTATQLQARVALVTHSDRGYLDGGRIFDRCLNEWGRLNVSSPNKNSLAGLRDWELVVRENLIAENSLTTAASVGVDIIVGKGEFCPSSHLVFNTGTRKLRSRYFLLATGSVCRLSNINIDGAKAANCLTYDDLREKYDLSQLPQNITIVGDSLRSIELAQSLAKLNRQITLIIKDKRLLATEDLDTTQLIQAHLEVTGIEVITAAEVTQIKQLQGSKWLQAGDRALETEEVIFGDCRQPNIENLNLAGVDVKYNSAGVIANRKLQTTNPKIYACGDVLGGYALSQLARYEANIALKNMLFFPWFKTDYRCVPWGILTQPNMMRVGLTEKKAKQDYGEDIYVVKEYFKSTYQGQITGNTTGWCKLSIAETGEILGGTIICDRATELITTIALMMQHKIKLSRNLMQGLTETEIPYVSPSFSEIFARITHSYHLQKLQRHPKLVSRLKSWFKH